MIPELTLHHEANHHVEVRTGAEAVLWRYVYAPKTPANESPRPYFHPVRTLAGDVVTNFRPNDHPWHHALSLTLTSVNGVNFWGGPSHRAEDGYQWRDDHGEQIHRGFTLLTPTRLEQKLEWCQPKTGAVLLREIRGLQTTVTAPTGWSLQWTSELTNATKKDVTLGNYHASGGLAGSHYTGLQFRGARELLDQHGDAAIGVSAENGLNGATAVHGASARWMEWACQHDGTLRRTRIRFENLGAPLPWFVRGDNPLAAFAFHRDQPHLLRAGATLRLDHRLSFIHA